MKCFNYKEMSAAMNALNRIKYPKAIQEHIKFMNSIYTKLQIGYIKHNWRW